MAFSQNFVSLVGVVMSDVNLKYTAGGKAYARFKLVTSEKYKEQEQSEWHQITAWGKIGEAASKFLKKNQYARVEGAIHYSRYDKGGTTVYSTEITARLVDFGPMRESRQPKQEEPPEIPW